MASGSNMSVRFSPVAIELLSTEHRKRARKKALGKGIEKITAWRRARSDRTPAPLSLFSVVGTRKSLHLFLSLSMWINQSGNWSLQRKAALFELKDKVFTAQRSHHRWCQSVQLAARSSTNPCVRPQPLERENRWSQSHCWGAPNCPARRCPSVRLLRCSWCWSGWDRNWNRRRSRRDWRTPSPDRRTPRSRGRPSPTRRQKDLRKRPSGRTAAAGRRRQAGRSWCSERRGSPWRRRFSLGPTCWAPGRLKREEGVGSPLWFSKKEHSTNSEILKDLQFKKKLQRVRVCIMTARGTRKSAQS